MNKRKWIGVDLDGTLAEVSSNNLGGIGKPIPAMWSRVNMFLNEGNYDVKIFTARAGEQNEVNKIRNWLKENNLPALEVTNAKDKYMVAIWDDKAVRVERNSGKVCEGCANVALKSSLNGSHYFSHGCEFTISTDC